MSRQKDQGAYLSAATVEGFLRENWLLIFIVVTGIVVRLYAFGSVPPGLNQDEASVGYDAFAILHYGIDRHGFHIPVVLVDFGSGQSALPAYFAMPFYLLFGVSVASLRAVNLVGGILSLPAFYAVLRTTGDKTLALIGTFLLVISPWHIMISRWALDANLMPALFLFGVFFLLRARKAPESVVWAAVFFALTLYSYATAYLATPLFLVLVGLGFFIWYRPRSWKGVAVAGGVFCVLALPIGLYLVVNQFKLSAIETPFFSIPRLSGVPRYQSISTLVGGNGPGALWTNVRAFWHLLVSGNDGLIWNAVPGFPYLYRFGLVFVGLGLAVTLGRKRFSLSETEFLFVAWLVAGVAVAASETVNINRINVIFLPLIYFAAVGIRALASSRLLMAIVIAYYCVSFGQFADRYFGTYRAEASTAFFDHFGDAVDTAASATSGPICITERVNEPYIFVLFYRKTDPHVFTETVTYENPGAEFENVASFDRFTFGLNRCDPTSTQGYVADQDEASQIDQARFSTQQIGRYIVGLRR